MACTLTEGSGEEFGAALRRGDAGPRGERRELWPDQGRVPWRDSDAAAAWGRRLGRSGERILTSRKHTFPEPQGPATVRPLGIRAVSARRDSAKATR